MLILPAIMNQQPPAGGGSNGLLTGLVSYWKLDEVSGTRVDSHGSNNLTPGFDLTYDTGVIGNAAKGDGSSDYLEIADNASLSITGALTLSVWVKTAESGGAEFRGIIGKYKADPGKRGYDLLKWGSTNTATFLISADGDTAKILDSVTTLTNTAIWYHLVAVYVPSTSMTIYINGVQDAQDTTGIPSGIHDNVTNFMIANRNERSLMSYSWNGLVDEAALYSRALTAADVTALYNSGSGLAYSLFD